VVVGVLAMNALFPRAVPRARSYMVTTLVTYHPLVSHESQPITRRVPPMISKLPAPETPAMAKLSVPVVEHKHPAAEMKAPELKFESKLPTLPSASLPKVLATNTFSSGSSAVPTTSKQASQVQTGGFGDPNGVRAHGTHEVSNIRAAGSFDLPSGSGQGNGLGGKTAGVVESAGFGNGTAIGGTKMTGTVQQTAFDTTSRPEQNKAQIVRVAPTKPVEILSKPKPAYTEEGRKLKLDGEVRLEVLFKLSGQVHVIRVIQGLGYGLDQEAVKAAEQIKFNPALHEGQPVDSTAVVHIVFQLAS